MFSSKITGLPSGTCKYSDDYVAVDTTDTAMAATGTNKRYALRQLSNFINEDISPANYLGVWNATTNTPTLTPGIGNPGDLYIVNVAGNFNLDGITTWNVGDWVIFDEVAWRRVPKLVMGDVLGPPLLSLPDQIALYNDATGKMLKSAPVSITDDGFFHAATLLANNNDITAVALATTGSDVIINTSAPPDVGKTLVAISTTEAEWQTSPFGNVTGPAILTDNAIVRFDGTTGRLIQNSSVLMTDVGLTTGILIPSVGNVVTARRLSTLTTDVILNDVAPPTIDQLLVAISPTAATWQNPVFNGSPTATDNAIVRFDGTTGKEIQNSTVLIDDTNTINGITIPGNLNSVTATALSTTGDDVIINTPPPNEGYLLKSNSAISCEWVELQPGIGDVIGPTDSTDSAICVYDGPTGIVIKNSNFIIGNIDTFTDTAITIEAISPATINWAVGIEEYTSFPSTFFISKKDGSNPKEECVVINLTGNYQTLKSCSFQATITTPIFNITGSGGLYNFQWQNLVYDVNNNFPNLVDFIAPISGVYQFSMNVGYLNITEGEQNNVLTLSYFINLVFHNVVNINPIGITEGTMSVYSDNYFYLNEGDTLTTSTRVEGINQIVGIEYATLTGRLCN